MYEKRKLRLAKLLQKFEKILSGPVFLPKTLHVAVA